MPGCRVSGVGCRAAIAGLSVFIAGGSASAQVTAVKAGRIITMNGPTIVDGVVLIRNGRIAAVGKNLPIPAGAKVIDASGKVVMPGIVAALTRLGDRADSDVSVTPESRALEAFDFSADQKRLLEAGITSAYVSTPSRRLVSGQGAVVKLAGSNAASRTVRGSADVRVTLGDLSKSPPTLFRPPIPPTTDNPILPAQQQLPTVRPSEFAVLRQLFADARRGTHIAASPTPGRPVSIGFTVNRPMLQHGANAKLGALGPVLRKERPLRVVAHTAGDILKALAFADEQHVKIVLEGATEGYRVADIIAKRQVPVVVESTARFGRPMTDDLTRRTANGKGRFDNAAVLARAGVRVALAPRDDAELPNILLLAAYQCQQGTSRYSALRSVTSDAAFSAGAADRLGSIAVEKDADLLILSGDPLDTNTRVETTLVSGSVAFQRPVAAALSGAAFAIRAGRILTATQGEIRNGVIIVRGGKIESVNRDGIIPAGMRVIDASNSVVMPGMIDSHSYLGLHSDTEPAPLDPPAPASGTTATRSNLANALEPNDPAFTGALRAGVTSVLLAPPTSGAVSGRASLIKTALCADHPGNCKERVVKETAAVCLNAQGGSPRMAQVWNLRDTMQRAKDYLQRRAAYEQTRKDWERDFKEAEAKKTTPPTEPAEVAKDEDLDPFGPLFRKEAPAMVHAGRADEIQNALKVIHDEFGVNVVLVDPTDGFRIADDIRKSGCPAALGPGVVRKEKGATVNNADVLARAGVPVVFQSSAASGTELLRMNAAYAVRNGMDPAEALRALTINPARAFSVQDRLGSIEPGKDADLVVLSGDPFDLTSRVLRVLVNGKEAFRGK